MGLGDAVTSESPISNWIFISSGLLIVLVVLISILTKRTHFIKVFLSLIIFSGIVATVCTILYVESKKDDEWAAFARQHCTVIEKRDGQNTTGAGISLAGKIGVFQGRTSGQTGYKCDDGVTYWKNN